MINRFFVIRSVSILLSIVVLSSISMAGPRIAGNGADGVSTKDGVRLLDRVRVPKQKLIDLAAEGFLDALLGELEKHPGYREATYYPVGTRGYTQPVGLALWAAVQRLHFYRVTKAIPVVGDRGAVVLQWNVNGKPERLAIQYRDKPIVHINDRLWQQMPQEDRVAFFAHEAAIRMYLEEPAARPLRNIEWIAAMIQATFGTPTEAAQPLSAAAVARLYCDAGISVGAESNFDMLQERPQFLSDLTFFDRPVHFMRTERDCQATTLELLRPPESSDVDDEIHREWHFMGGSTYVYSPVAIKLIEQKGRLKMLEFKPESSMTHGLVVRSQAELERYRVSFWKRVYLGPPQKSTWPSIP